ncbi:hypothetical protein MKZ08_11590 [Viridibacillus sp. FSL R5-0477]|uniref:Uncharacterized protein n=1 Tax=Viridibacillus arenosi FSL R5-213 TaxID=1227360 RepID=W4F0J5_9BACL|nr:hypothetical protein [Viridibacillus arenosi]ETT86368.1 hypothetical protein C176_06637 [Viridibacillus arenosi FSL R5-213]OMC91789.1 hypothetical protein BK137_07710 [Viridibacillus arenosi]
MKGNKSVFVISLVIIIGFVFCYIFFSGVGKASFKNEFWEEADVGVISQIELIRGSDSKQILYTKEQDINVFVSTISEAEIKKVKESSIKIDESYWITIWIAGDRKFGLRIENNQVFSVFNYEGSENNANLYEFKDKSIYKYIENLF